MNEEADFIISSCERGDTKTALKYLDALPPMRSPHSDLAAAKGHVLRKSGREAEGLEFILDALGNDPDGYYPMLCRNLAHLDHEEFREAIRGFEAMLYAHPGKTGLYVRLARAYALLARSIKADGDGETALPYSMRALYFDPADVMALICSALCLHHQGRLSEAKSFFRRVLALAPDDTVCLSLGLLEYLSGSPEKSLEYYRKGISYNPQRRQLHVFSAYSLLYLGDFANGWRELGWGYVRGPRHLVTETNLSNPGLKSKRVMVYANAGFGDTIHFARYIPMLSENCAEVYLQVNRGLERLFGTLAGVSRLVHEDEKYPPYDYYCSLGELPEFFATELSTIPAQVPYLGAEEGLAREIGERIGDTGKLKVGLCWTGGGKGAFEPFRSPGMEYFSGLFQVDGVKFFCLQKNGREEFLQQGKSANLWDLGEELGDFTQTAALMDNLDLIITCDTSVAHLSGALNVPAWVALLHTPDFRWMRDRGDSPWYPSMRLYRQPVFGDWRTVFERILAELADLALVKKA